MRVPVHSLLAALILSAAVPALSARALPTPPEEVARRMLELTRQGNWAEYVQTMHPDALAEFKRMFGEVLAVDATGELGRQFFGTADAATYAGLDASILFQRFMTQLAEKIPPFAEALRSVSGEILGSVADGPDVVHVVVRSAASSEGLAISRVSTVTVKKHEGEWRALLNGSIEGIAARLQQLARQQAPTR